LHAAAAEFTVTVMSGINRAMLGGAVWVGYVLGRVLPEPSGGGWVQAWLLLAALVLVPLALDLFAEEGETGAPARGLGWARHLQLPAALLLTAAHLLPPGGLAGLAALPWVGLTGWLAVVGVGRIRRDRFRRSFERLCGDVALVYLAIGGGWALAERAGVAPRGFDVAVVALTAVHFHYAGFLLTLFAGRVQQELFVWRLASRAAVGVVLGVPAVALGSTVTQLGWGTSVETAAGCGLALAGMAVGILQVRIGLDGRLAFVSRMLLMVSGASLFVAMTFSGAFALRGSAALAPNLAISPMGLLHGSITALGFGLAGVLGWRSLRSGSIRR